MIGWIWMLTGLAWADFALEGPPTPDRAVATAQVRAAKEEGLKSRVVRRFADGAGWEYVARVEGLADLDGARAAADRLTAAWSVEISILDAEGSEAHRVSAASPGAAPAPSPEAAPPSSGAAQLERAQAAHGDALAWMAAADQVKLEYRRVLPDGREAAHRWARRGTDLSLGIEAVAGSVAASRTVVLGDAAWLSEGGGALAPQDAQRARETIERFGPTSIAPVVLGLERAAADHGELATLEDRGTAKVGGEVCAVVGSRPGQPDVMIAIGEKDGLVRRIAFADGERVHEYSAYREVAPGVRVPFEIRTSIEGTLRDTVRITAFEVNGALPDAWFQGP